MYKKGERVEAFVLRLGKVAVCGHNLMRNTRVLLKQVLVFCWLHTSGLTVVLFGKTQKWRISLQGSCDNLLSTVANLLDNADVPGN